MNEQMTDVENGGKRNFKIEQVMSSSKKFLPILILDIKYVRGLILKGELPLKLSPFNIFFLISARRNGGQHLSSYPPAAERSVEHLKRNRV